MIPPERWATFQTASRNHMYHALGLIGVSFAASRWETRWTNLAGWLLVAGIVLFSGSLYLLALTGIELFGANTGLGGVAFLGGWTLLAVGAWRG